MRLQRSDQNPDLARPLPPAADRRVQKGNVFGSIGIVSLMGALALIAGLFVIADDGFFQRDRLVLKAAIERIAPDRPPLEADMMAVNAIAGLESLRLGAAAGRGLTELYLPLDPASDQALIWSRSQSYVVFTAICISLVVIAMIAIFGITRVARAQAASLRSVVEEIEGRAMDMAMRDPLTGLFNRSAFRRRLENAVAKRAGKELIGVLYVDLDRFKEVNDGFGHHAGDTLLSRVTDRLRELSGQDVTIARLGGDEFALIIERQSEESDIEAFGQSISRALGEPFDIGEAEVSIGGSVGLAVAPVDAYETAELVRRADIAMYRVKESGRGTCLRFDESMEDDAKKRKSLESDLRKALDRNELHLNYQPYFASDGETMVGVEALVRWNHPEQGLISPAVFVPIAEDSGLIHQLSDFVMQTAMRQAMEWPDLTLALNLSPVQFRRKETVGTLLGFVEEIGIDPKRIEIEITEGVLVEDTETAIRVLKQFHDAGMHIALDDFGTGYSSLSYLRRFPFDKLKIDQSFVRNLGGGPGSAAIIHAVVSLGRALGLIVHAEGVETLEHHIFLRASGCHHMQGFYFARPMPAEEITKIATKQIGMIRPYPRMWA
jgi:diguanylate cyclase (GGDEF)-like protein